MSSGTMDQKVLIDHLLSIHNSTKEDFRWKNLRLLVKDYLSVFSVKNKADTRVLDLGCGTGHLTLELLQDGYDVTAADISEKLIDFVMTTTKEMGYRLDTRVADVVDLRSFGQKTFDAIVCLDMLEHVNEDELALKNINSIISRGGLFICSVPALKSLYGKRDKEIGHFRRYNIDELTSKMNSSGFNIEIIRYWNFLGVIPVAFSEKILHKKVYEKTRYSKSIVNRSLNAILMNWFYHIENRARLPIGLTLVIVAKKL